MYGYDPYIRDYDPRYDDEETQRLRLMAFVDGRLVSTWTERVEESAWADIARRFDRERERQVLPPPPPPVPTYERVLAWLDDVCGDREELLALSPDAARGRARPARGRHSPGAHPPHGGRRAARRRRRQQLRPGDRGGLPAVSAAVWDKEPEVVLDAATAAHVAGGVAWVVAKANGVLGAQGRVTVTQLKHALALSPSPSTYGKVVQRALVGYRDFEAERTGRVYELPDLLPLGRTDLLLGGTRRTLCRARDRALEAQEATAA